MTPLDLRFAPAKETKGTWKFEEVTPVSLAEPKVGTLYVRKNTLAELGWAEGSELVVTLATS
jgi:hypothetical protein